MAHDVEKALKDAVIFKYFALITSGLFTGIFFGSVFDDIASALNFDAGYRDSMPATTSALFGVAGAVTVLLAFYGHSAVVTHENYLKKYGNS